MGNQRRRRAMERQAEAQERVAKTGETLASEQSQLGREGVAQQRDIYETLRPYAESLISSFDPERDLGEVPFPDIQRPDFTGQIRRDYFDDLAGITQQRNRDIGEMDDYMTASGMSRTGARGMGLASAWRGAGRDESLARREMQGRLEGEERDKYSDVRDLSLQKFYSTLGRQGERASLATAGANILGGQQGVFSPHPYTSAAGGFLGGAGAGYGGSANTYYNAGQLPGAWQRVAGGFGRIAAGAAPFAPGGGGK